MVLLESYILSSSLFLFSCISCLFCLPFSKASPKSILHFTFKFQVSPFLPPNLILLFSTTHILASHSKLGEGSIKKWVITIQLPEYTGMII
ncbi:hypothetical protein AAZX31_18G205200 [Glycine max]